MLPAAASLVECKNTLSMERLVPQATVPCRLRETTEVHGLPVPWSHEQLLAKSSSKTDIYSDVFLGTFSGLMLAASSRIRRRQPKFVRARSARQQILDIVESVVDEIPSSHFVSGSATSVSVTLPQDGDGASALSWPSDVDRLLEVCTQAKCGKGAETVTDLSVRCVMETEEVAVQWPGLVGVLQEVQERLLPGTTLRAEFDKLLVYRPGDFFKGHKDSKRCDDHVATLIAVTDCPHTGGEIVFQDADPETARWEEGAGSWCCWLSSSKHEILPITEGHRIVAAYKILAEPCSPSPADQNVVQLAWRLHECMPELKTLLEEKHLCDLGFLLHHDYSFDGKPLLDLWRLVGRDRALRLALEFLGFDMQVREVKLVHEFYPQHPVEEDGTPVHLQCRVASEVAQLSIDFGPWEWLLDDSAADDDIWGDPEKKIKLSPAAAEFYGVEELRRGDALEVLKGFPGTDVDDPDRGYWPVMGCLWCTSPDKVLERFRSGSPEGTEEDLWGNAGTFSVYWYKTAALVVRVREDSSPRFDVDIDLGGWDTL